MKKTCFLLATLCFLGFSACEKPLEPGTDNPGNNPSTPEPVVPVQTKFVVNTQAQGGTVQVFAHGNPVAPTDSLERNTMVTVVMIPDDAHILTGSNIAKGCAVRDSFKITQDTVVTPIFETIQVVEMSETHKICNYNIRYWNGPSDTANKGDIAWPNRKDKVFEMIRKHNMDVCGIEEITKQESPDVVETLTEYEYIGYGRDNGKENATGGNGEQTGILYKKARYVKLDQGRFFLSETPWKASRLKASSFNRMVTWVKLKDRNLHHEFYFFATHFDHPTNQTGVNVRSGQADIALDQVAKIAGDKPLFFVGDFNCEPTEPAYEKLASVYEDAYVSMGAEAKGGYICNSEQLSSGKCPGCIETGNTYTGLYSSSDKDPKRIDFVLRSAALVDVLSYLADNDNLGLEKYPSDHLPIITEMKFK
jgi:endonuclease/exonuclease/phosphatase family metal-dependent hydrolase